MARERVGGTDRPCGNGMRSVCYSAFDIRSILLCSILCAEASIINADASVAVKGVSHRVNLVGSGDTGTMPCEVVQVLDSNGDPIEYFTDVDSVACAEANCEIVKVRIYFDPIGNYARYELPSGGNLTKRGHRPFSRADHQKLDQILSDPYSQLKSITLDQITIPKDSPRDANDVDGISGATVLSKREMVVAGAAYTCLTLWHWSHGEVVNVIRGMTIRASDKQDLIRYLRSGKDEHVVFALEQLRIQNLFDTDATTAVAHVLRRGNEKCAGAALHYLEEASIETGVDHFFCCCDEECLVANSGKRVRFLEALKETRQEVPAGYVERLAGWLRRADSYYEVHLLLSLLEREDTISEEAVYGAMLQLESPNPVVVRRCYRYLKAQRLNAGQRKALEAFEQQHPDP